MMEKKITAGILGATALTGRELVKILLNHSGVQLDWIHSNSSEGKEYSEIYPQFTGKFSENQGILQNYPAVKDKKPDVVFSCLPHAHSAEYLLPFYENNHTALIDLSADFRLKDETEYKAWYGIKHPAPRLLQESVFGLSEIHRQSIARSRIIGNPGCYPTSILLPLLPLLKKGLISTRNLIADAKSGVSGAGKKLSNATHYINSNESFKAYKPGDTHRHLSEIREQLNLAAGISTGILFTPHLVPMDRGILSTLYCDLENNTDLKDVLDELQVFYKDSEFVHTVTSLPSTGDVYGTNNCHIYAMQPGNSRKLIIISVIDNLIKGASGQAVQNMNLIFGFAEGQGF